MQDTPPMTALEIRIARKRLGFSQRAFADALCNTSRRTIEDWETSRSSAPSFLRLAIAALDIGLKPWSLSIDDKIEAIRNGETGRYDISLSDIGDRNRYDNIVNEVRALLSDLQIADRVSYSEGNVPELNFTVEIGR